MANTRLKPVTGDDDLDGLRKDWKYTGWRVPHSLYNRLNKLALAEGRKVGRPKSVQALMVQMLLKAVEQWELGVAAQ